MDKNLLDILQNRELPIENEQLISYLKDGLENLSAHDLEEQEMNDPMIADALDGLRQMNDKAQIAVLTKELNAHLHNKIKKQQKRRNDKKRWPDQNWILITIVSILILLILAFLAVKVLHHN